MTINSKDKRDVYYFMAKQNNYRARSIYKLKQINEKYKIFDSKNINVLDLCAAPGSWSQYLSEIKRNNNNINKIIAVDLQDMEPIENVDIYKADITDHSFITKMIDQSINIIICDGAPDVTGFTDLDLYAQMDLLKASLEISLKTRCNLFLSKIFRNRLIKYIVNHFRKYYREVILTKPRASRGNSTECFILCRGIIDVDYDDLYKIDFNVEIDEEPVDICGYDDVDPDYYVEEIVKNDNYKNSKPIDAPYNDIVNMKKQ